MLPPEVPGESSGEADKGPESAEVPSAPGRPEICFNVGTGDPLPGSSKKGSEGGETPPFKFEAKERPDPLGVRESREIPDEKCRESLAVLARKSPGFWLSYEARADADDGAVVRLEALGAGTGPVGIPEDLFSELVGLSVGVVADQVLVPTSLDVTAQFMGWIRSSVPHTAGMPVRLRHIVIDAHDLPGLARSWAQAPGWKVLSGRESEIVIGTDENAPAGMCFMPVTEPKTVKNRVHLDLTGSAADRDQEIDRLRALGARRAGIGQAGAESWTVLADPEGNEFCVVRPKETLIR